MININYGMNKDLMAACSTLEEYAIFIDRVRRYTDLSMSAAEMEKSVDKAVNECIKEGVLFDFLTAHKELKNCIAAEAAQFLYQTCAPYQRYGQGLRR